MLLPYSCLLSLPDAFCLLSLAFAFSARKETVILFGGISGFLAFDICNW